MSIVNVKLRKLVNWYHQKQLKNHDFSIIASNCIGSFICHDLHVRFNLPFVNLWLHADDFMKYLQNMRHYNSCNLTFIKEEGVEYPIGLLDDIKIYFQHYKSEEEAKIKWIQRVKRINYDNLFVMFTDRDGCTYQHLKAFEDLDIKNKVVFTHKPYSEFKSAYHIKGFEQQDKLGNLYEYRHRFTGFKYYDQFQYVKWLNKGE
ncbi:DUF1919 domain-containing protein [Erysipelotrichaceae bacterium OH741_COT-311]|nr:DUF1919 domain-containing protein [Erysipelotrichaceae bacterium OH741_COT-311]